MCRTVSIVGYRFTIVQNTVSLLLVMHSSNPIIIIIIIITVAVTVAHARDKYVHGRREGASALKITEENCRY